MSIKFLVLGGGGGILGFGGGGSADFISMGAGIFLKCFRDKRSTTKTVCDKDFASEREGCAKTGQDNKNSVECPAVQEAG